MYFYVTLEELELFLLRFGLDITTFTGFEQSIVLILGNIFVLISWYFIFRSFYFCWVRVKRLLF